MSDNKSNKANWVPAIVTLIIGALVTVGATYYTIYEGQKQTIRAEQERYKKVKDNIVSIVEEHIVNKKAVDFNRLQRIVDIQQKEENLLKSIPLTDIFAQAEYNILNSRHLDIEKKDEYESWLNRIFEEFLPDSTFDYSGYRYPELLKGFSTELSKGNDEEVNKVLLTIIEKYESELDSKVGQESKSDEPLINLIFEKPSILISVISIYLVLSVSFLNFYRTRLKRRREHQERAKALEKELEYVTKELDMQMKEYLEAEDRDHKEMYKHRIDLLQKEIEFLRKEKTTANKH